MIVRNYTQTGNKGIEIAGRVGSPVRAAASGRVIYSGAGLIGYGNLIIIKHDDRYLTAYANNRRLLASKGDKVQKGEPIAEVGTVAGKTPRLHFELRKYGKPVDPIPYLPK